MVRNRPNDDSWCISFISTSQNIISLLNPFFIWSNYTANLVSPLNGAFSYLTNCPGFPGLAQISPVSHIAIGYPEFPWIFASFPGFLPGLRGRDGVFCIICYWNFSQRTTNSYLKILRDPSRRRLLGLVSKCSAELSINLYQPTGGNTSRNTIQPEKVCSVDIIVFFQH